ncbi:MAG: manganese efflux pump [Candidatus Methanomethylophilaceae archaeon]|nr:manganese efflux pump [Candidatus Methanomethylophilaceae archaeon]
MDLLSVLLIAVGLAMDAFSVAIAKGLQRDTRDTASMLKMGLWTGGFQFLMPVVGFYIGSFAHDFVEQWAHWIAFAILCLIGANMIYGSLGEREEVGADMGPMTMLLLAVATSIDALMVGFSMNLEGNAGILPEATAIGAVTLVLVCIGFRIGNRLGSRIGDRAQILGGVVLIVIGFKVLLEGLDLLL